jgi:hypothetical protein
MPPRRRCFAGLGPASSRKFGIVRRVAVTGMANLAVKVRDVDAAAAWYGEHGFEVRNRMSWNGIERADVFLGPIQITLFDRAIYEREGYALGDEGFLHPALFCDDLDAQLAGHDVVHGPLVVEGPFGVRRIAFVEAPGGIRLEFMEQLRDP